MTRPAAPRRLHHESFGFILLLGLVTAIQAIGTMLTLPALPAIAEDFASTPDTAQLTISGFLVGVACGQLASGALADRYGRRPVLLGGITISVLTGIGCIFAPTIESLIAMRVLQGVGGAAGMILGRAIVRDVFEGTRALKAQSAIAGIVGVVPMAGPPLAGLLLQWLSWRSIFALIMAITLVLGVLTWRLIAETLKQPDPKATDPGRILANCAQMLRRPECMTFVAIGCLTYGGLFAILAMLAFVVRDSFGMGATAAGWLLGATALASWSGAMTSTRISGRVPVGRTLGFSTALIGASALAILGAALAITHGRLGGSAGFVALVAPVLAYTYAFGLTHPNTIVLYLRPLPQIAGTASALGASFQTVAGAVFAWLAGLFYDGTPTALGGCVAFAGVSVFLIFRIAGRTFAPR